ncbi:hypothetical protein OIU34_24120 [Pararhizobium sp. BT-229]|uniref:hypothetical protein n=1 Tax=Pararhizobium sp. BT-229 TaxID=2986923 RepID=UPI0021F6AB48|nr:hypothetical protein [Pararhizobium sp. BT-229]MCV9964986.1 hypothetical protein [Pararhizobium sp. BT-229]
MTSSVQAVAIDDVEALKLGFFPGCIGVPTVSEGAFVLIGLSSDRIKVMFSPDTGGRPRSEGYDPQALRRLQGDVSQETPERRSRRIAGRVRVLIKLKTPATQIY